MSCPQSADPTPRKARTQATPDEYQGDVEQLRQLADRCRLDPTLNEERIPLLMGLLDRLPQDQFPEFRGSLLNDLGYAYSERVLGDRQSNLQKAIAFHLDALGIRTLDADPVGHAMTQSNLGLAYSGLPHGDRVANLERAIMCHMSALAVFTPLAHPSENARVQANLGLVYAELPTGDRTTNMQRAIACYQGALLHFTRSRYPRRFAILQNNLGNAFRELPGLNRSRQLQMAIGHYQQALQVATRKRSPSDYAMIQNNLGIAYALLPDGDQAANLTQATRCFRKALTVYRRDMAPYDYARAQMNLGNAYRMLPTGDRYANQRKAIACYRRALIELTLDADPYEYANLQNNLGNAHAVLSGDGGSLPVRQAIACYQRALAVYIPAVFPSDHRMTASSLGQLHFARAEWQEAHDAFRSALAAGEQLRQAAVTEMSRQSELSATGDVAIADAYCLARLGRVRDAVARLEGARTRALSEALARDRAVLARADWEDREAFATIARHIRELEALARVRRDATGDTGWAPAIVQIADELRQQREELYAVAGRIRQYLPDFMPEGFGFESVAGTAEPDCPIVYLATTLHGSLAIVVPGSREPAGEASAVLLDRFTEGTLVDVLGRLGQQTHAPWGATSGKTQAAVTTQLAETLSILGDTVMGPLTERLLAMGYTRCSLVPCGRLGLLPLHAAQLPDGPYLDRVMEIALAPSAQSLHLSRRGKGNPAHLSLFAVVDPPHLQSVEIDDLRMLLPLPRLGFARTEVERIAALFSGPNNEVLLGDQATRSAVLARISTATHLHFACHASFNASDTLASALALVGEESLTVADLLNQSGLSEARLAVLAACDTAVYESLGVPDEVVGFPAAFIQAGIPGVISALWPVDDAASALLLLRFYQYHMTEGVRAGTALHEARRWLRESTAGEMDLARWYERLYQESGNKDEQALRKLHYYGEQPDERPFAHPYYWAAFTFTGANL